MGAARTIAPRGLIMLALAFGATSAQADDAPIAAIDWLTESLEAPSPAVVPVQPAAKQPPEPIDEPEVSTNATAPSVAVQPLGAQTQTAIGLAPQSVTGLPLSLWSASDPATLAPLIRATGQPRLPAIQTLLKTLLTAEAETPLTNDTSQDVVLARIDGLLALGDVEPANALVLQAGTMTPELFRRHFDLALLTGTEDTACATLAANQGLRPTPPTRIFCLARTGDWTAAALTLRTAEALETITPAQAALLSTFLDPELAESTPDLAPPSRITPLEFVLRDSIGAHLPTRSLPLAFATTELSERNGWRAQIDAAIRLSAAGSLPDNQLLGILTANIPSASGSVWDQVDAWQRLDVAITTRDPGAISTALPDAWNAAVALNLEVPLARLYAAKLAGLPLRDTADALRAKLGLLSQKYETIKAPDLPFAVSVAKGNPTAALARTPRERAILDGFARTALPVQSAALLEDGKLGEAILRAIVSIEQGLDADLRDLSDGLAVLRRVGLEDVARRTALQVLLLDPQE